MYCNGNPCSECVYRFANCCLAGKRDDDFQQMTAEIGARILANPKCDDYHRRLILEKYPELDSKQNQDQGETMKIIKGILAYDIDQLLEYEAEVSNISDTPETEPRIEDLKAIILSLKPQDPEETIADLDIDLGDAINTATQDAKERYLSPGIKEDELFDDGMARLAEIYHPDELEETEASYDYQVVKGILHRWGNVYTYIAHVGYSPAHYVDILEIRRKDTGHVLDNVAPSLTEACFDDAKERFLNFPNIEEDEFYSDFLARMYEETKCDDSTSSVSITQQEKIIQLKAELKETETKLQNITFELVKFLTAMGVPLEVEDSQCIHGLVLRLFRGYADITIEATKDMLAFFTSETEKQKANESLDA